MVRDSKYLFVNTLASIEDPNMYGVLIMTLPSPFTGGEVLVTHEFETKTFDAAPHSPWSTSFNCLYVDGVSYEVLPIKSGHSLTLHFDLVHKSPAGHSQKSGRSPVPTAPCVCGPTEDIRKMLSVWKGREKLTSRLSTKMFAFFLQYNRLLDGDITSENIMIVSPVVAFIRPIAAELGFSCHLAQLCRPYTMMDHQSLERDSITRQDSVYTTFFRIQVSVCLDGESMNLSRLRVQDRDVCPRGSLDNYNYDRGKSGCGSAVEIFPVQSGPQHALMCFQVAK